MQGQLEEMKRATNKQLFKEVGGHMSNQGGSELVGEVKMVKQGTRGKWGYISKVIKWQGLVSNLTDHQEHTSVELSRAWEPACNS